MPRIGYTKIYPNIYQVMFMENLTKSHVNSLIGEKIGYIKQAGEQFFENYQNTTIENIKKVYDYSNRLFMIKESQLLMQIEKDGTRYMFPTNSIQKVFQFLKARGVKKFPAGTRLYYTNPINEQGYIPSFTFNRGGKGLGRGGGTWNIDNMESEKISLNPNILEDWLSGPLRQVDTNKYKDKSHPEIYRDFFYKYMYMKPKEIILFDGTRIEGKSIIFNNGEYNIQLIYKDIKSGEILTHVVGEQIEMPETLKLPPPLFSEYIGTKATDIDFNERPLIMELNRFDQFKKDIEKRIENKEKTRINKKLKMYEQLKSRLDLIDQYLSDINIDRVQRLKYEEDKKTVLKDMNNNKITLYKEDLNSFKNLSTTIDNIAKGNIRKNILEMARDVKKRSLNPNDEFALKSSKMLDFVKMVKETYDNILKFKMNELNQKDNPKVVYEAVLSIMDQIDLFLQDIQLTGGKYFVVRGTLKKDDIENYLTKLKTAGLRLIEHMVILKMI